MITNSDLVGRCRRVLHNSGIPNGLPIAEQMGEVAWDSMLRCALSEYYNQGRDAAMFWLESDECIDMFASELVTHIPPAYVDLYEDLLTVCVSSIPDALSHLDSLEKRTEQVNRLTSQELRVGSRSFRWRLANLYKVIDHDGNLRKFVPNFAQQYIIDNLHTRNWITKSRQHGITTLNLMILLDFVLFNSHKNAVVVAHSIREVQEMFRTKISFPFQRLPQALLDERWSTVKNVAALELNNGSQVRVTTSSRGGTPQAAVVTELGYVYWYDPVKASEIVTGVFNSMHRRSFLTVESTAYGMTDFYTRTMRIKDECEKAVSEGRKLDLTQFRLFFLPWYWDKKNVAKAIPLTPKEDDYFARLETEQRVSLSENQKSWYVMKARVESPAELWREHPSVLEEAFRASAEGAFYSNEMATAYADGRVSDSLYDPTLPVWVAWDLGKGDLMVLIFYQLNGLSRHVVHVYANHTHDFKHYIDYIEKSRFGFTPFTVLAFPHDIKRTELMLQSGETRLSEMRKWAVQLVGGGQMFIRDLKVIRVPRITAKIDDINMLRIALSNWKFEVKKGSPESMGVIELLKSLSNYRRAYDAEKQVFADRPTHDISSHYVDAMFCAERAATGQGQDVRTMLPY